MNVAPGSEAPQLFTFLFEESECSLASFSISIQRATTLALWENLMIFILPGSKLPDTGSCVLVRQVAVGGITPPRGWLLLLQGFVCTQSGQTFQKKLSTILNVYRLAPSMCLVSAQWQPECNHPIHIKPRGDNKKSKRSRQEHESYEY